LLQYLLQYFFLVDFSYILEKKNQDQIQVI